MNESNCVILDVPQTQMAAAQSDYDQANNRRSGGSYDSYGNQTVLGASTLGDDAENRLVSAYDSVMANTTVYKYDGLGQRVSKQTGSGTPTQYVRDAFGNLAAEYSPSDAASCTTCYLSTDHLGSTRLVTDRSGGRWRGMTICRLGRRCRTGTRDGPGLMGRRMA